MKITKAKQEEILKLIEDSDGYLLIVGIPTNSVIICEGDVNSIAPAFKAFYIENDLIGQMIAYATNGEPLK